MDKVEKSVSNAADIAADHGCCLFADRQLDRQRGRCPPEWTSEVFGMHLDMTRIPGLEKITQPVVSERHSRKILD